MSEIKTLTIKGVDYSLKDETARNAITEKQDVISDLDDIRSGAALGATAVQPGDLAAVATSGSYNDLSNKPTIPAAQVPADWNATTGVSRILNKPTIPTVPTNVSAFTNDSNYQTGTQVSSAVSTHNSSSSAHSDIRTALNAKANNADLATVATSGSYNDLSNKPIIPTVPTNVSAFTNDAGYQTSTQVNSAISTHNSSTSAHSDIRSAIASKSVVSVNATGTATDEVRYITIDGVEKKLAGGGSEEDNLSITKNASDKIQTIGVIDQNSTTRAIKEWFGTRDEYDAIASKDPNTEYTITDDSDLSLPILQTLYPVGSVYMTFNETCPLANLFGTWQKVGSGRVLQGADSEHIAGSTIEAGLPNITGDMDIGQCGEVAGRFINSLNASGAIQPKSTSVATWSGSAYWGSGPSGISIDASLSNSIYGNSNTVQPPAICINIFRRTA